MTRDKKKFYTSIGLNPELVTEHEDGSISYRETVYWNSKPWSTLPIRFKDVSGNFYCSRCPNLTSLAGAPQSVGGSFSCSGCPNLTSLAGAPQSVWGDFSCSRCPNLTSLTGAPQTVGGEFSCSRCPNLTSLTGAPQTVGLSFVCYHCANLRTLEGCPQGLYILDLEGTKVYTIPSGIAERVSIGSSYQSIEEVQKTLEDFKSSIRSDEDAAVFLLNTDAPGWQLAYVSDYLRRDIQ